MPATRPDALPPIDVGAWLRVSSLFQGQPDTSKLNDWQINNAYVELHAGGKIHKNVGVTLNLNANMLAWNGAGTPSASSLVALEDAIISFDIADEFHIWAGHLLVPVDRANASGPFFMIPWNYPGFLSAHGQLVVSAPKEGPSGRNNGAVVWGDIAGGKLTYLVGVFDNGTATPSSPLVSGRVRLALWDPEPGFWGNASYFGDKDMLSIGVGAQFQKHGSSVTDATTMTTTDKNWADINVDVLMEKKLGGGSFVTLEGAYYHDNVLSGGVSDSFYVLGAYATPTVGIGSIQPMVRYQYAKEKDVSGTQPYNIDAGLSYLIKGPALRLNATYSYTKLATDVTANGIQLGAQAIFF
ncbi:MAG TPA: hypothetical protein VHH90_11250 [Polyangia bacterium]|nr:hypothetical protein [Polyangia bacterium]